MSIYGFAFDGNISSEVLARLKNLDHKQLLDKNESIGRYLEFLLCNQPQYILGLGQYTGSFKGKIKIEARCFNRYGTNKINPLVDFESAVDIKPYVAAEKSFVYSNKIGRSYCNLISWKIMELINGGKLNSKYSFLHIPKTMSACVATEKIADLPYSMDLKPII